MSQIFRKLCFGKVFEVDDSKTLPKQSFRSILEKFITRKLSFGRNRMIRKLYQMKVFVNMEISLTSKNYQMKDPPVGDKNHFHRIERFNLNPWPNNKGSLRIRVLDCKTCIKLTIVIQFIPGVYRVICLISIRIIGGVVCCFINFYFRFHSCRIKSEFLST